MTIWLQHLLVLLLVAGCLLTAGWQAIRALRGRARGCSTCRSCGSRQSPAPARKPREHFLPAELVFRRK